jgi:hypothetical protein
LLWLFWRWGLVYYFPFPGWPQNVILPTSASQAARIYRHEPSGSSSIAFLKCQNYKDRKHM